MKTCTTCNTSRSVAEFSKNPQRVDGLQSVCKYCVAQKARERWANGDRTRVLANTARSRALERLRKEFPEAFRIFLDQERSLLEQSWQEAAR